MTIERQQVKKALITSIIGMASENSSLDSEDQEMLIKYHLGEISKSELEVFITAKACRLEQQIRNPQ